MTNNQSTENESLGRIILIFILKVFFSALILMFCYEYLVSNIFFDFAELIKLPSEISLKDSMVIMLFFKSI